MARVKSLITQTRVDRAKRSHGCQANSNHRIEMGDARLKVKNGRSWDHYCISCAKIILERDMEKLAGLKNLEPKEE